MPVDIVQYARKFKIPLDPNASKPDDGGTIFAYHIQNGIVTINEVRKSLKLPALPGGDKLISAMKGGTNEAAAE